MDSKRSWPSVDTDRVDRTALVASTIDHPAGGWVKWQGAVKKHPQKLMIGWISRFVFLNKLYGGYVVQLFAPTGPHARDRARTKIGTRCRIDLTVSG